MAYGEGHKAQGSRHKAKSKPLSSLSFALSPKPLAMRHSSTAFRRFKRKPGFLRVFFEPFV
jgi:hypothetical protein